MSTDSNILRTHKYKIQLLFPELEKNMGKYIFPGYFD